MLEISITFNFFFQGDPGDFSDPLDPFFTMFATPFEVGLLKDLYFLFPPTEDFDFWVLPENDIFDAEYRDSVPDSEPFSKLLNEDLYDSESDSELKEKSPAELLETLSPKLELLLLVVSDNLA